MADDWAYARIIDRDNRDRGPNRNALRHKSGNWKIAKYPGDPTYALFDIRGKYGDMVGKSNDLDELKRLATEVYA